MMSFFSNLESLPVIKEERKKEARKGKQRGRKGSRDTEMLGGREGKAGQYLQRKASEKMGINYF